MIELVLLSVVAGVVTTLAGLGGGLFLLLGMAALHGPHLALAATTPALLCSNVHRALLFRSDLDLGRARAFALGAVPAAALCGYFVISLPGWVLQVILIGATALAILRYAKPTLFAFGQRSLTVGGALVGGLTATSGGAGLLTSPLLLGSGLSGAAYVSTVALCAVSLHSGRLLGYGVSGLISAESLGMLSALVPGLVLGNLIGKRVRSYLTAQTESRLEVGVLVACCGFGVVGLTQ